MIWLYMCDIFVGRHIYVQFIAIINLLNFFVKYKYVYIFIYSPVSCVYIMCSLQKSTTNLNFPFSLNMNYFTSYNYYMSMPHNHKVYLNRSREISCHSYGHDDVIKWKHFPRYWPFVRGIHRSLVNFPHKGQWRGALMFSLIYARINAWINDREIGDLRRYRAHYGVTVMLNQACVALGWDNFYSDSDVTDWLTYSRTYCLHCSVWLIKLPVNETWLLGNGDTCLTRN